jgi:hypothetical protein
MTQESGTVLSEMVNTGQGDAILFRISHNLKHMVTAVTGSEPKTAFAGWFRSGETTFYETLRETLSDSSGNETRNPGSAEQSPDGLNSNGPAPPGGKTPQVP